MTRLFNDPTDFLDELTDGFVAASGRADAEVRLQIGGFMKRREQLHENRVSNREGRDLGIFVESLRWRGGTKWLPLTGSGSG